MNIEILYATETCKSEILSYELEDVAKEFFETSVRDMGEVKPEDIAPDTFYVMIVSTHGDGDLPIPGEHFAKRIRKDEPDYSGVRFAVFGLGDTVYDATYNWGCKTIAKLMIERNARLFGEIGLHDASDYDEPEDVGVPWLQDILEVLSKESTSAATSARVSAAAM